MAPATFDDLTLPAPLLRAITDLGFTTPTDIQAQAIPALLDGRDITGVAQTGTGKTAAFGLPLLAAVDPQQSGVQALILCPTRELAMQVSGALTDFAKHLPGIKIVSVYGGAPFLPQKSAIARGAQIVVGTPGRIIDHLERRTLDLSGIRFLVLDEADEMLKMGFAEDVDRILEGAPSSRQTALFSATMPPAIAKVARTHLTSPVDVKVQSATRTTTTVEQSYAVVPFRNKVDTLVRVLALGNEVAGEQQGAATIVFVRTKSACDEVGAALAAQGISAAALNGDVPQREREKIVDRLRNGSLDVLVATDVAARGLDVERIGLVVNFDAPRESETYVHRIGRTGRAGRLGRALTFFTPREVTSVRGLERATGAKLTEIVPPTMADVAKHRTTAALSAAQQRAGRERVEQYRTTLMGFAETSGISVYDLAAALLASTVGDDGAPIQQAVAAHHAADRSARSDRSDHGDRHVRGDRFGDRESRTPRRVRTDGPAGPRYRVEVGRSHGVRPAGIVGAITGEGGIAGRDLGRIDIFDTFSTVEIGTSLSPSAMRRIAGATVSGQQLRIALDSSGPGRAERSGYRNDRPERRSTGGRERRSFSHAR